MSCNPAKRIIVFVSNPKKLKSDELRSRFSIKTRKKKNYPNTGNKLVMKIKKFNIV